MFDEFPPLMGICRSDAVIVGGGLTGLLTGAMLAEAGLRVAVLDAGRLRGGASGLCSGVATVLSPRVYGRIRQCRGQEAAAQYAADVRKALSALPRMLRNRTAFREADVYAYAFLPRDLPALEAQLALCESLGLPVSCAPDAGGCPFPVELSMMLGHQLLVDVPPLLMSLARQIRRRGGEVYGQSRVTGMDAGRVYTPTGRADAPRILLTAGKPPGLRRLSMLALLESRTMVSCRLESAVPLHTAQQSVRENGLSLRPIPGGMLASWCAGRTGAREAADRTELLRRVLQGRLPDWTAGEMRFRQDIWPLDGLPVIGALPEYRGDVLCACGYSGFGLTGAMLAAEILSRQVLGRTRPADRLYSPERRLPGKVRRQAVFSLLKTRALGRLRSAPHCPHLGCTLRYHPPSRRWECPFCGSTFTMFGDPVSGPALRGRYISPARRPEL